MAIYIPPHNRITIHDLEYIYIDEIVINKSIWGLYNTVLKMFDLEYI